MKTKLLRILGVGLTMTLLASLLVMATPASAATLLIGSETNVPKEESYILAPTGSSVVDMAVSGSTIFAATGNLSAPLLKSTDGGATWTNLKTSTSFPSTALIDLVAIAPDDPDVVCAVTSNSTVEYSTNGGSSWTDMGVPVAGFDTSGVINGADVSEAVSGVHYLALAGTNTGGTAAELWTLQLAVGQAWTARASYPGFSVNQTAANAVKFSPNFHVDKSIAIVSGNATSATFQIFRYETDAYTWNGSVSFLTDWATGVVLGAITGGISSADIAMIETFDATDEGERIAFVSFAATTESQVMRVTDTYAKEFDTWSSGEEGPIHSIAYHSSGKLLAGDYDSNQVYRSLSPMATTPKFERLNTIKKPGGENRTLVAWSGDTAVAGTSGDESAFAVSTDDGYAFNDISLIDTDIAAMSDVAVSADGSIIYLATYDTTATTNDASIWVRQGGTWQRVFSSRDLPNANAAFLVRFAPEDATVVYISSKGTQNMWVSKNSGTESWKAIPCYKVTSTIGILDFAVQDADTVYAIDDAGVSKTTSAGSNWGTKHTLDGVVGANIALAANGDILVGGSSGYFAFSKDGGSTFDKSPTQVASGTCYVLPDKDFADNNLVYVSVGTTVKRGTAVATSQTYSTRGTLDTGYTVTGMAQNESVVYVLATSTSANATKLYRALNLKTAATEALALWSSYSGSSTEASVTPQALKMAPATSDGPQFWFVNAWDTATSVTMLKRIKDPIALVGPTLKAPANEAQIPVNPATGKSYNPTFTWLRYSSVYITSMQLQMATDSAFDGIIYDNTFTGIDADSIAKVIGPTGTPEATQQVDLMPGATYYWRVRVAEGGPALSAWSGTRQFKVAPATGFTVSSPASGSTGIPLLPSLVWAPVEGAVEYFVVVSKEPNFETILTSSTTENTFYTVDKSLDYSMTYYWRVRPTPEGAWANGVFTTMAAPVALEPTVIVQPATPAPPEVVKVEVPTVIQQPIPSYLLWLVIVIGALLVIALIVLIVRTRRVA